MAVSLFKRLARWRQDRNMLPKQKSEWLVLSALLLLCLVPAIAGIFRLVEINSAAEITLQNSRFFASPLPVTLHILGSLIFGLLGAVQFSGIPRHRFPNFHRRSGRFVVMAGLVSSLSGLWMTQYYLPALSNFDGPSLYALRLVAGAGMTYALLIGLMAGIQREISSHRKWMVRAYAIGMGAGTQAFTHIPWFLFPNWQSEIFRTACMAAGWAINIAIAEFLIVHKLRR